MSDTIFAKNLHDVSRFTCCPQGWREVKVDDLSALGRGRVISEEEISNHPGPYPVYSSQTRNNGEMGRLDSFDFEGEWITWTTDGANAGTVFYRNGQFNCTNVCGTIRPKDDKELDLPFFAYHLGRIAKNYVSYIGNPVWIKQARVRDVIICRGCKSNIQLDDGMNSVRKARQDLLRQFDKMRRQIDQINRSFG